MGWAARWARDLRLVALAMLLTLFGVAMIYSAGVTISPQRVVQGAWVRQLIWFVLALGAFTAVVRVPSRWFEWAATPAYVVTMVLLAITLVIGTGAGTAAGTRSSIALGPLRFQPAELAKLATILMIARHLANRSWGEASLKDVLVPAALAVLPLMLVLLQPDLGTAQAFIGVLFAMLFWAGFPLRILVLVASPGVHRLFLHESAAVAIANLAAGTIARPLWNSLAEYQQNRLLVFLNPDIDPRGAGYHLIQSKIAIGNGGLWGRGFTEGSQKRYDFLPEQHTDFIFSVVGEELGFIGVMAVLVLFGLLLARLVRMAEDSDDPFAGLVLLGIFGAWFVHIVVNIGMTIGLVPITGIPLPFVSYGGTFLLMSWFAVAIAASAGRGEGGTRS
jgi:rod shape determining protein RodA